jgi:hypothetical protein
MSLRDEVEAALQAQPAEGRDRGTATLALTYATQIDGHAPCETCECQGGADLAKLGPALLAALEALHMSPRARAAVKKAIPDDKPSANPIDELAQRRAGIGNPPALDAASS